MDGGYERWELARDGLAAAVRLATAMHDPYGGFDLRRFIIHWYERESDEFFTLLDDELDAPVGPDIFEEWYKEIIERW